jgi:hypothetical protein
MAAVASHGFVRDASLGSIGGKGDRVADTDVVERKRVGSGAAHCIARVSPFSSRVNCALAIWSNFDSGAAG